MFKKYMFKKWVGLYIISWIFHTFIPIILTDIIALIINVEINGGLFWILFSIIVIISIFLLNLKVYDNLFDKMFNNSKKDIIGELKIKMSKLKIKIKQLVEER